MVPWKNDCPGGLDLLIEFVVSLFCVSRSLDLCPRVCGVWRRTMHTLIVSKNEINETVATLHPVCISQVFFLYSYQVMRIVQAFYTRNTKRAKIRCLVYPHMSNGSLEDVLGTRARRKGLNAQTRVRIALGVAQALDYLHTPWLDKPAIIHRDVKVWGMMINANMPGDMSMSSCLSVGQSCQGNLHVSRHMAPIPGRNTPHYLFGNPCLCFFIICVLRAAMPSSTAAASSQQ